MLIAIRKLTDPQHKIHHFMKYGNYAIILVFVLILLSSSRVPGNYYGVDCSSKMEVDVNGNSINTTVDTDQQDNDTDEVDVQAEYKDNDDDDPVQNSTVLAKPHRKKNYVTIKVPKAYLKYHLQPKKVGRLVVYNAQDLNFYLNRTLKEPMLKLWILTKKTNRLTYANKRLFEEAWRMNIQIYFVDTSRLDMIVTQDGLEHILYKGERIEMPDCVYPRLGATIDYFGMAIIRQLEKNGVLVMNPIESIEISKDKLYSLQHLAAHNLPIPKTMITKVVPLSKSTIEGIEREFSYPLVLKKSTGSQGKGVILVHNQQLLKDVLDMLPSSNPIIFQEYISRSKGRDIRVFVIGGKAIGAMMRIAPHGNFKSNFHQGGYVKRVKLSPAVEWLAIEAARLIGLDIAGVDILIDNDTYRICEVNSSPGFEAFELGTQVNVPKKILEFVTLRSGVWKKNNTPKKSKSPILISVQAEHIEKPTRKKHD